MNSAFLSAASVPKRLISAEARRKHVHSKKNYTPEIFIYHVRHTYLIEADSFRSRWQLLSLELWQQQPGSASAAE
jgi:hypothetical protein